MYENRKQIMHFQLDYNSCNTLKQLSGYCSFFTEDQFQL